MYMRAAMSWREYHNETQVILRVYFTGWLPHCRSAIGEREGYSQALLALHQGSVGLITKAISRMDSRFLNLQRNIFSYLNPHLYNSTCSALNDGCVATLIGYQGGTCILDIAPYAMQSHILNTDKSQSS